MSCLASPSPRRQQHQTMLDQSVNHQTWTKMRWLVAARRPVPEAPPPYPSEGWNGSPGRSLCSCWPLTSQRELPAQNRVLLAAYPEARAMATQTKRNRTRRLCPTQRTQGAVCFSSDTRRAKERVCRMVTRSPTSRRRRQGQGGALIVDLLSALCPLDSGGTTPGSQPTSQGSHIQTTNNACDNSSHLSLRR